MSACSDVLVFGQRRVAVCGRALFSTGLHVHECRPLYTHHNADSGLCVADGTARGLVEKVYQGELLRTPQHVNFSRTRYIASPPSSYYT